MGRTVAELSAVMTTDELARWMAYARTYPIGDERMDYLFANLCAVVCNSAGAKKRGGGQFGIKDFLMFKVKDLRTPVQFMRDLFGSRIRKK
jgi:hypothetical protein